MDRCEDHEIAISSWIDGELDTSAALATCEHLLECEACATFFGRCRGLEPELALLGREVVWKERAARPRPPVATWVVAAVVALLLVGVTAGRLGLSPDPSPAPTPVELGDAGKMSDDRFVAVATELLEADPRDRLEMLQVLQHVQTWNTEESPGDVTALRTDVDLSPRWSELPLDGGEPLLDQNVY
jgi:hypothetical protein